MKRNLFYIVKSTYKGADMYLLFNAEPTKHKTYPFNDDMYIDGTIWDSNHGYCCLNDDAHKYFDFLTIDSKPFPVKLDIHIPSKYRKPDMYLQRVGDNLFIDNHIQKIWKSVPEDNKFLKFFRKQKWKEVEQVRHVHRISNKLFSWLRESDGIIGMDITPISLK